MRSGLTGLSDVRSSAMSKLSSLFCDLKLLRPDPAANIRLSLSNRGGRVSSLQSTGPDLHRHGRRCQLYMAQTRFGETDRSNFSRISKLLRSHRPERRKMWRQSRRCTQIDGKQGVISGHVGDHQNPFDFPNLSAEIPTSLPTQDEPSCVSN